MEEKSIVAIEIGSSKVRGAIGTYSSSGVLTVQAVEEEPLLDWVRYGAVSNVEETAALLGRIIRKIENRVSPRKVSSVYVGMGGRSFCSLSRDVETRFTEDVEITEEIISRLTKEVAVSPSADRELLEVVPKEYIVDRVPVERPKGTIGRNFRLSANLIVCRQQVKRNLDRLFAEKMKLNVAGYKVRQLAIADVVLTSDEKRLGCMLVDFGAETTTVSIYKNGRLQYLATLPLGSRNITRDIMKLNYLEEKAEELKCTVGAVRKTSELPKNSFSSIGNTDYTEVNNYVSHRADEIITNIRNQIRYAGYFSSDISKGIIIVGSGSLLNGFNEYLATRLSMPLRVGSVAGCDNIRIPDSRFTDACDIISVLYRAAVDGAEECLVTPARPVVVAPAPIPEPEEPASVIEEIPEQIPGPRKKPSFMERLKAKVEGLLTENDYDDDSVMRDD